MAEVYGPQRPEDEGKKPPTSKGRTPKRKMKYAPGHTDLFRSGHADDPMSSQFIPMEERTPIERARLFARARKPAPKVVEFD